LGSEKENIKKRNAMDSSKQKEMELKKNYYKNEKIYDN